MILSETFFFSQTLSSDVHAQHYTLTPVTGCRRMCVPGIACCPLCSPEASGRGQVEDLDHGHQL